MNDFESDEINELIKKFEYTIENSINTYFDRDEMEFITNDYILLNDHEKADIALSYAINLHGNNKMFDLLKAKLHFIKEEYNSTVEILEDNDEIFGDYFGILAESYLHIDNITKASENFRKFLLICHVDDIQNVYADIISLSVNTFHFNLAKEWVEEALLLFSDSCPIFNSSAVYFDATENYPKAIETINKSLDIDAYNEQSWNILGHMQFHNDRFSEAKEAFLMLLALKPDDLTAHYFVAHCLFHERQFENAKSHYWEYLQHNKYDSSAWSFYAECFESLNEYEQAIDPYKNSLSADHNNIDSLLGLSACFYMLETKLEEATTLTKHALSLQPENYEAIALLGSILLQRGINENNDRFFSIAVDHLKVAHENDPHNVKINGDLGFLYIKDFNFKEALKHYLLAYEYDSELYNIELFLTICYYGIEDTINWHSFYTLAKEKYLDVDKNLKDIFPDFNNENNEQSN